MRLDEEQFRAAFRRSPVKRARWAGLRRNVAAAMHRQTPG
jgi:epoxyqueuosine reductase QueG